MSLIAKNILARRQVELVASANPSGSSDGIKKKRAKKTLSVLTLPIYNLPDSVLLHIAGFVENSSRVLLAVALTASSTHWRSSDWNIRLPTAARTILTEKPLQNFGQYSRVDFVGMGKDLASKLSDEDVGGVLACIGAIHTINSVKITHCTNILGYGLGPLRTSTSLEQLDLCLVEKKDKPNGIDLELKISKSDVIPILDSILDVEGSPLKHIKFPKKWRVERSQLLGRFLAKYNRVMNARGITCSGHRLQGGEWSKCEKVCHGTSEIPWINKGGDLFGEHNFTCYTCCRSYCTDVCAEYVIPEELCAKCEWKHCIDCTVTLTCDTCGETMCHECSMIGECDACGKTTCGQCCPVFYCRGCDRDRCLDCVPHEFCEHAECSENNCAECSDEHFDCVRYCLHCETTWCAEHLLKSLVMSSSLDDPCSDCKSRAALKLSESNKFFGRWVQRLENKYSHANHTSSLMPSTEDFSQAMETREELRRRCHAVGNKLMLKQKQFERFDYWCKHYESNLA